MQSGFSRLTFESCDAVFDASAQLVEKLQLAGHHRHVLRDTINNVVRDEGFYLLRFTREPI